MLTSYNDNGVELVKITLPTAITIAGQYTVSLYNSRQSQRQALSQVLRPRADN
jgi:hypothetical protein